MIPGWETPEGDQSDGSDDGNAVPGGDVDRDQDQSERLTGGRYTTGRGRYRTGMTLARIYAWAQEAGAHDVAARYGWIEHDALSRSRFWVDDDEPGSDPESASDLASFFSSDSDIDDWIERLGLPSWDGGADGAVDFLEQIDSRFFGHWKRNGSARDDPQGRALSVIWLLGQEWGLSMREINRLMHVVHGNGTRGADTGIEPGDRKSVV